MQSVRAKTNTGWFPLSSASARERSIRDGLTGLYNHRYFYHFLRREFLLSNRRTGSGLACLLLDLDNFKKLNDTHGHQFGDTVLKTVASRISKTVRETDVVSRYGGEETARLVAREMAAALGWDEAELERQVGDYLAARKRGTL